MLPIPKRYMMHIKDVGLSYYIRTVSKMAGSTEMQEDRAAKKVYEETTGKKKDLRACGRTAWKTASGS